MNRNQGANSHLLIGLGALAGFLVLSFGKDWPVLSNQLPTVVAVLLGAIVIGLFLNALILRANRSKFYPLTGIFWRKEKKAWLDNGKTQILLALQSQTTLAGLSEAVLSSVADNLQATAGLLYLPCDRDLFLAEGFFGISEYEGATRSCQLGEGLVGQAIKDRKARHFTADQGEPLAIQSGLGSLIPRSILVYPLVYDQQVFGAFELALPRKGQPADVELLDQVSDFLCASISSLTSHEKSLELLKVTQNQALALERSREELSEKAQALIRANKFKSQFLANMSHELRSPLNSVLILSQMMVEKPASNAVVAENARTIQKCSEELLNLINDILDLSKVEAGKLLFRQEAVNLAEVAHIIDSTMGPIARRKGLDFVVNVPPSNWPNVESDQKRLIQIIRNLVTNAIKFTAQGQVKVAIDMFPGLEGCPFQLTIAVHDTGIGIPQDKQVDIFGEFEQADSGIDLQYGGTGLGLSISLKLAQGLGGDLDLESIPGQGSTFTLRLPCTMAQPPSDVQNVGDDIEPDLFQLAHDVSGENLPDLAVPTVDLAEQNCFAGQSILILGPDMRRVFSLMSDIEERGGKVAASSEPPQAQLILEKEEVPDLIILDSPGGNIPWKDLDHFLLSADNSHIPIILRGPQDKVDDNPLSQNPNLAALISEALPLEELALQTASLTPHILGK